MVAARLIPAHAGKTGWPAPDQRHEPAHPRSRGENNRRSARPARKRGSSPLTRGKHRERYHCYQEGRLIPAHAGKTARTRWCADWPSAHPRSRGENAHIAAEVMGTPGSSPLTRGKHCNFLSGLGGSRLIPAHAGKTYIPLYYPCKREAHPRSRGENELIGFSAQFNQGSSPLTRGKRHLVGIVKVVRRLIPAHAGKTRGA